MSWKDHQHAVVMFCEYFISGLFYDYTVNQLLIHLDKTRISKSCVTGLGHSLYVPQSPHKTLNIYKISLPSSYLQHKPVHVKIGLSRSVDSDYLWLLLASDLFPHYAKKIDMTLQSGKPLTWEKETQVPHKAVFLQSTGQLWTWCFLSLKRVLNQH
jgi:hypothetical protein